MEIGAQFFTVRDFCRDLDGLSESLKRIADIGYKNVQISGTCRYEPEWLRQQLELNGLKCVLTHIPAPELTERAQKVTEAHDIFNCKYVGLGYYDFDQDNTAAALESFGKAYMPVAQTLAQNGKYFMYHNHHYEFKKHDGKTVLQHIAQSFPAELLGITLDTYWVQVGGGDPAQWLERLAGRVPVIHLKDCAFGQQMAAIGEGNINFDRVFQKAESSGTGYMLVEQDNCYGEDPFVCLARSYKYLKAHGFE